MRTAIFDVHLHIPSESKIVWEWAPATPDLESFIRHLDRTGITKGIITSTCSEEARTPEELIAGNREVARVFRGYPVLCSEKSIFDLFPLT